MSNPFDSFDAPAPSGNPFDQFDQKTVNAQPLAKVAEAHGFFETVKAGAESSVGGLIEQGKTPDLTLPKDAGFLQRQEFNITQMALDAPVMAAGALIGGGVGALTKSPAIMKVGAAAGAFMLPTAARETLMDHYANGSVESFGDLWNRAMPIMLQTAKSGLIGAATAGAGLAAKPLANALVPGVVETVAPAVASGAKTSIALGAQAATLATTGAALDGRIPTRSDFEDSAAVLFGLHAAVEGGAKLRGIYTKTGIEPTAVYQDAKNDPAVQQDLLSSNVDIPKPYEGAVSRDAQPTEPPKENELDIPGYGRVKTETGNIPWAAGASKDQGTVFYDKALFENGLDLSAVKAWNGKTYDFRVPWGIHEKDEAQGEEDQDEDYMPAHNHALGSENAWVDANWPELAHDGKSAHEVYEEMSQPYIDAAADRAKNSDTKEYASGIPGNLIEKPYDHPDNPLEEKMHDEVFNGGKDGGGEPPKPDEPMSADDARKAVLDRLSVGEQNKTSETLGQRLDRYYTNIVDSLYPIKAMVGEIADGKKLPVSEDPGKLAQLLGGLTAKADGFIKYGTRDFNTYKLNGKGLQDILKPAADDLDGFRSYWVAKRALELNAKDIKTGVPLDAAQTLADDSALKAKYDPILADLRNYRENLLNYGKDIIGEKAIGKMLSENPDYAPFQRVVERMSIGSSKQQAFNPIKAIKGSDRTIIDPLESLIKQTYQIVSLTERNAVNQSLAGMLDKFDAAKDYISKVPRKMWPIDVQADEMARAMAQQGIKGDPDAFTIFRPQALTPADNQIAVFKDGKKSLYQIPDDVAAALKGLDRETVQPWIKMLGTAAQTLRVGTTLTPEFQLRHALRMGVYSFLYSDKLNLPFAGLMRGALGALTKDSDYQDMMQAGAAHANIQSFDREFLQGSLEDAVKESSFINKSSWNVVGLGISKLQGLSQFMDTAWRVGEYKSAIGDQTSKAAQQEAAYKARTVIVDLAQSGARMKALNSITAFQSTIINDSMRMVQALKNEPAKVLPRIIAGIVLPSVLLWASNRKNEAVQNMPDWEKDSYWLIPTGDKPTDAVLRYPKPFGVGLLFGSGVERGLDYAASGDPKAFDNFAKDLVESMVPTDLPNFITPPIEQFANKSLFTGGPIIPHDREEMLPAYQYSPYTSETAKALSKLVGPLMGGLQDKPGSIVAPAIIENYIRGWTGTMGQYALQVSDYGLKQAGLVPNVPKPTDTLSDIPFVRAFVARYPSSGAQPVEDFYDHMGEMKAVQDTVAKLTKEGKFDDVLKIQQEKLYDLSSLQSIEQTMKLSSQVIRQTYIDPNMSPDDKRQLIDSMYFQMIEVAKSGNEMYEENRKAAK